MDDLERQTGRVVSGATGRGLAVGQVVAEIGSGLNGHRRKLTKLLSDPAVTVIVAEHRDRLTDPVRVRAFGCVAVRDRPAHCGAG